MATGPIVTNSKQQQQHQQHASTLEHLERLLVDVSVRDLVPTLVARGVLYSHEMGSIYSQASQEQRIAKLVAILKTKKHCVGPLIDTLIRNGQTSIAETLMQLQPKPPPAASTVEATRVDAGHTHKKANGNADLSAMRNGNCNGAAAAAEMCVAGDGAAGRGEETRNNK